MRTVTITPGRARDVDDLLRYSTPYRYRFADGDRRIAVWLRDEEHDYRQLLFADADTGAADELLNDVAPEYGGVIVLCRDGQRVVHQDDTGRRWAYRDREGKKWRKARPVPTRFEVDDEEDEYWEVTLAASADGRTVVLAGHLEGDTDAATRRLARTGGRVQVWRVGDDGTVADQRSPLADAELPGVAKAAVPDGDRPVVALASTQAGIPYTVWDWRTGERLAELDVDAGRRRRPDAVGLSFSPDGSLLAARVGGRVQVWDTDTWTSRFEVKARAGEFADVAFTPDSRTLAVARGAGVHFYDLWTGAAGDSLAPKSSTPVVGIDFAPDGLTGLAGYDSGDVVVWDVG